MRTYERRTRLGATKAVAHSANCLPPKRGSAAGTESEADTANTAGEDVTVSTGVRFGGWLRLETSRQRLEDNGGVDAKQGQGTPPR